MASLVARKDLPPAHPHRLVLLIVVWLALAMGGAATQVAVELASLWIVKLRLTPSAGSLPADEEAAMGPSTAAPFIKPKRAAKSPAKKPKAATKGRTKKK